MTTKKLNTSSVQNSINFQASKKKYLLINRNTLSKKFYTRILAYDLILKQNYSTVMQLANLEKISLNTTSKNYVNDKKFILYTLAALELISGQKPELTYARKSVANFKIREKQILGCKVILRENLMYAFLDKLSRIVFPRIRDYTYKKVVKNPNSKAYTFGLKNLMIFPELENHFQLVEHFRGLNLTFVLSNTKKTLKTSDKDLILLLSGFQIPVF